jgi:hypothetical protein
VVHEPVAIVAVVDVRAAVLVGKDTVLREGRSWEGGGEGIGALANELREDGSGLQLDKVVVSRALREEGETLLKDGPHLVTMKMWYLSLSMGWTRDAM